MGEPVDEPAHRPGEPAHRPGEQAGRTGDELACRPGEQAGNDPVQQPGRLVAAEVPAALDGERLDRTVALLGSLSRAAAAQLLALGQVTVDGEAVCQRRRLLRAGQRLSIVLPDPLASTPAADPSISVPVVYEDDDLIVVDKPAGMVVHRGAGNQHGTMVEGLLARYPELANLSVAGAGDADRPGVVHRLDKDTSGLLAVARSVRAYHALSAQFRRHEAGRTYLALVHGVPDAPVGVVDAPIGRSVRRPTLMALTAEGRPARTAYEVVSTFGDPWPAALLRLTLQTGRTHQIRVHLAAIGHPVVGDDRYGPAGQVARASRALGIERQFLHACRLVLTHPDGSGRTWESPLPPDLVRVLQKLRAVG